MLLLEIHRLLSNMISIYTLIMGAWGLINFFRRRPPDPGYNGALIIAVGLFVAQGLAGMALVLSGAMPSRGFIHFLYGITVVLTIPAIYAFTRGSNTVRESFLYGAGMLFIWGLAQRAVDTAH